jgi:hypothetical protein
MIEQEKMDLFPTYEKRWDEWDRNKRIQNGMSKRLAEFLSQRYGNHWTWGTLGQVWCSDNKHPHTHITIFPHMYNVSMYDNKGKHALWMPVNGVIDEVLFRELDKYMNLKKE